MLQKEIKKAKDQKQKAELAYLLGDSYKNINQLAEASVWFKTAYDYGYGTDALKAYAFSLKTNQEYKEAMQAFKELGIEIGSPYSAAFSSNSGEPVFPLFMKSKFLRKFGSLCQPPRQT